MIAGYLRERVTCIMQHLFKKGDVTSLLNVASGAWVPYFTQSTDVYKCLSRSLQILCSSSFRPGDGVVVIICCRPLV